MQQVVHCTRCAVLVCQWCIVVYLWIIHYCSLCMSYFMCYLWLVCICVFILPLELDWNPQISRVCVCVCVCVRERERERFVYVFWGFQIRTHDLKYFFMWPPSYVTSAEINNSSSSCFLERICYHFHTPEWDWMAQSYIPPFASLQVPAKKHWALCWVKRECRNPWEGT